MKSKLLRVVFLNACVILTCSALLGSSGGAACAANTTYIIDFTANGFDPGAPTDPVTGSFTITFDPSVITDIVGTSVVVNRINLAGGGKPYFYYRPNSLFGSLLVVCSSTSTGCVIGAGQNSYYIQIANFQTTPRLRNVAYSAPGAFIVELFTGSVSISTERNRPLSPFALC